MSKKYLFYAEIAKGYVLKVIVDCLGASLKRGYFSITEEGIQLRQSDKDSTILFDIDLPRKNFKPYKCFENAIISVNLKHMQGMLKNVKKKDSIAIYREKSNPGKLTIEIRPEGGKRNGRIETNGVVCQIENDHVMDPLPDGGYKYPMVIEATDFQKTKRLTTTGKIIDIEMQRDNYLLFKCDAGVVLDSKLCFGSLLKNFDDDEDKNGRCYCNKDSSECECVCNKKNLFCPSPQLKKGCGEYLQDCECICKDCEEYIEACSCDETINKYPEHFKQQYHSTMISKLVKIPGLCAQMQFYAPEIPAYPLRIEANAGQGSIMLGTIQVFIKDIGQIKYEESVKNEVARDETLVVKKPKVKKRVV
jgi:Proliferating cell nuclear antigen, N-terminal domain